MTSEGWRRIGVYLNDIFGSQDEQQATLMQRATEAGLPDIAVSAEVGHLLSILTRLAGPASLALEIGTLAGYSGIWIARALSPGGRLVTIEFEEAHADVAQAEFEAAGVADRVEIVRGAALDVLPELATRLGPASVDFVFLDAVKAEYPAYFELVKPLLRPGGVLVADNVIATSGVLVPEQPDATAGTRGVDAFNRMIAADPAFETACVPLREGLTIALRV